MKSRTRSVRALLTTALHTITAIVVATLTLAQSGSSQQRPGGPGAMRALAALQGSDAQRFWTRISADFQGTTSSLALSDDQETEIGGLIEEFRSSNTEQIEKLDAMSAEMREQLGGRRDNRDRTAMLRAVREIMGKHGNPARALQAEFDTLLEAVYEILDDEQDEVLRESLAQVRRRPPGRQR